MAHISSTEAGLALLTVIVGAGTTCQVNINYAVGVHFRIRLFAAWLNLGSGLLLLTLLCALESFLSPGTPFLAWKARPYLYHLLPGLCGLCYVLASVFLLQHLGSSLFMVLIVSGQLTCAAALDHFGVGRSEPKLLTPLRVLALAAGVGGAGLSASSSFGSAASTPTWLVALSALGAFFVGSVMVVQALLSRLAAELLPSRLAATWWSFVVSAAASGALFALQCLLSPPQDTATFLDPDTWASSQWFMFTAALFGVAYVGSSIYVPSRTSSQAYFVCLVAGQLSFSIAVDHFGLFLRPRKPLLLVEGAGVGIVLAAAVLMQLPPDLCGASLSLLPKERAPIAAELNMQDLSERLVGERELATLE
jgi:transporter family-2 protein